MNNKDAARNDHREWRAPSPECVFILVHGLGTHSGRWEQAAEFFLKNNISSYAVELHDLDPRCNNRGTDGNFKNYYLNILHLRGKAAADNPGKKIFLAGESLGGLISFIMAANSPESFDGLIAIVPAFRARQMPSPAECVKMLFAAVFAPAKRFKLPFDSSMCTRDVECRKKIEEDPREYRSVTVKRAIEILFVQIRARRLAKKIHMPALFLIAGDDRIVDPRAAEKVFADIPAKDKKMLAFPGMYHALSIELGKEAVFEEIVKWARERASG